MIEYMYEVQYFNWFEGSERKVPRYRVKAINKKTISLHYYEFKIPKKDVGSKYFAKRSNAILSALIRHEEMLPFFEDEDDKKDVEKEVKSLRRMLNKQLEKEKEHETM